MKYNRSLYLEMEWPLEDCYSMSRFWQILRGAMTYKNAGKRNSTSLMDKCLITILQKLRMFPISA